MIPYKLPEEKETLLYYADLLGDSISKSIINKDVIESSGEATKLAEFFWMAVAESNNQDSLNGTNSEEIFEKIIVTLMAYYRSSGYEKEWEEVCDRS